ncbi:MAG: hypothetical protein HRU38_23465 [Saccharospirillaceae bacterium]|nr:hypothetical protein [Saccharospirillaceae bacterium]
MSKNELLGCLKLSLLYCVDRNGELVEPTITFDEIQVISSVWKDQQLSGYSIPRLFLDDDETCQQSVNIWVDWQLPDVSTISSFDLLFEALTTFNGSTVSKVSEQWTQDKLFFNGESLLVNVKEFGFSDCAKSVFLQTV